MSLDSYREQTKRLFLKKDEWKSILAWEYGDYDEEGRALIMQLQASDNTPTELESEHSEAIIADVNDQIEDLGFTMVQTIDMRSGTPTKLYSIGRMK